MEFSSGWSCITPFQYFPVSTMCKQATLTENEGTFFAFYSFFPTAISHRLLTMLAPPKLHAGYLHWKLRYPGALWWGFLRVSCPPCPRRGRRRCRIISFRSLQFFVYIEGLKRSPTYQYWTRAFWITKARKHQKLFLMSKKLKKVLKIDFFRE